MNFRIITYILGWVLIIEGAFLLLPCLTGCIYGESVAIVYLLGALLCALVGTPFVLKKPKNAVFFVKEGFVTVALCWIVLSFFGCLPFVFSGEIPRFTDALFETVSGFTTTGSSILSDVEALSHASLFWRSFTHWIGGMGVLVFLLAILPLAGGSQVHLMRAESPGPSVEKLVPKTRYTALILYALYILLTIVQFVFLLAGKMPAFDALLTTFGTAGTGGFGVRNDSLTSYSPYVQWVVGIFMVLFGVNFNVYFLMLMRKWKQAFKSEEVRVYFGVVLAATLLIFANIHTAGANTGEEVRHAFFQVASIVTTTGYATADFDLWPTFSKVILLLLMACGACAGSTCGGIKLSRMIILAKRAKQEIRRYFQPNRVTKIRLEGKVLDDGIIHATTAYLATYVFLFAASFLLISIEGHDMTTTLTATLTAISNVGPGLSLVGPTQNFGFLSDFSKWVLTFDMLVGRLELFPMLLLFHPHVWFSRAKKRA